MQKAAFIIVVLTLLAGWKLFSQTYNHQSNLTLDPPATVPFVNISKYVGLWYEQASIPQIFQQECTKTKATYTDNGDGTIRVNNTCNVKGFPVQIIGKAYPDPEDKDRTNARLCVQFGPFPPASSNYWVVRLDEENYRYSVVSTPDYKDLWILYRQPKMPDALFQSIYSDLQKNGFNVANLKKTVQ